MEDEEYKKLPIEERCVHKLWQARKNGYEEVAKLFRQIDDDKSPEFGKYLGLVKKFVLDSHAVGQEKGLEATLAFVENYAHAGKTVGEVMSGVVTKCIAAPKNRTKELAVQVILMYIEIEKGEVVQEELLKGMEQKNPKIVVACISAFTVALREFGTKIINVKPLVKKIPDLFSDREKAVRDEARLMTIEIYRWIGNALRPQLNSLKPVQISELEAEFAKIDGQKAVPQRYIRSQQQKQAVPAGDAEEIDAGESEDVPDDDESPDMDPYELADPVDILSKLPKDFYEKIEAKKWQERKEALEILEKLVQTPKLQSGDYGDLVRALKKMIEKDSNVVVVALAGRCLAAIAGGLKKRFQPYAGACVPSLLEKFKEKKQNVVIAIKEAIDVIYLTTSLEAILEDVIEALGNKNPSVKAETSYFLARAFTKTQPSVINKKMLKALSTPLLKNINESDPTVRDSAAEALGILMKLVGEKAIGPFLVELEKDTLKMTKIKECCEKAVITVKIAAVKKERPTTAPTKTAAPSKPVKAAPTPKSAPTKPTSAPKKKAPAINSATVVRPKGKNAAKKTAIEKELSDEQVDELVSFIPTDVINQMSDASYKIRLAAVKQYFDAIKALGPDIPTQALVKCLSRKPGLKDTNFQVLQSRIEIVKYLAENSTFSATTANICINDIIDKFGDAKNGALVRETVSAIAEATSLSFVSSIVVESALNQKNPKVTIESLAWLSDAIKEFGFNDLNTKVLIESGKKCLASSNPGVRQAAITFCGVLYLYIQNPLYTYFENEKAALRDQITVEFEKYQGVKPPTPTRGIAKCSSSNSLDNLDDNNETEEETTAKNMQDLLPRVDISAQITESLLNDLEDKNWKVRTETLTKIQQIIQDAKFIKPNLGDLPQSLNRRMADSNKQVAQTALNICEMIAKSMGAPSKQYIKVFFPMFLRSLGDIKPQMRTAAKDAINAYVEQCGYKEFFENEMIFDGLKSGTPQLKVELWDWLAEILPKIPVKSIPKEELVVCIPLLYSHLEDRLHDIRANSQKAILGIMIHVGYETMLKQIEKLKPGSQLDVRKKLDNERANLPMQPAPKKTVEKEEKVVRGTKPVANSKNAVKPKGAASTTKVTTNKKKDEDIDTSPLMVVNNMKHQRTIDESKLKVLKWNFTTPREEFVELLRDQMTAANVNKTLISNMFHNDFGYHIKALDSLMEDLNDNSAALIANLDLILKWLTLRFFDTNPSVVFKGLEYLHSVFNVLIESNYRLLENEASAFLPYLVIKIGDAKFCSGVRSLLKQVCHVYPVARLFTYIMEGVKSKNARQRAECLEAMGSIIQDHGIGVCGSSPAVVLKEVAKQISDKDKSVRNAALNCMVEAYHILGDKVYKMIGNILGKDLALLEGRIKHSKRPVKPVEIIPQIKEQEIVSVEDNEPEPNEEEDEDQLPPVVMPPKTVREIHEPTGPFTLDTELLEKLDKLLAPVHLTEAKTFDLDFLKDDVNIPTLSAADIRAKIMPLSPPKPLDPVIPISSLGGLQQKNAKKQDPVLSYLQQITSPDLNIALKGLQQIIDYFQHASHKDMEHEDDFVRAIIVQLKYLRNQEPVEDSEIPKIYRCILTSIDAFYRKGVRKQVSTESLKEIVDQLIHVLVSRKLENCADGDAYIRVINLHCVKIIEKSDHTRIICALIKLIHECIRNDSPDRHTELVMKCLWRVIKLMPDWGEELDYDSVLLELHNFLKEFPSTWWKNKPVDTTLRTIKTILHSSVKIKGGSIVCHFGKIPNPSESEIESYILKLLKSMKLEAVQQPPPQPQRISFSRATHTMLTEIFQKIGNKDATKEGLNLLYDFMQQHPEADIEPFLKKSSKFFQDYIQNGLQEIEKSRKTTREKVEEKVAEAITGSVEAEENRGPEYWEKRLQAWKKIVDDKDVGDQ
ncbi:protein mini spindles [Tribolium castaneum]|uniref:Mini spindles n=1 Tax=Tribolium castaneum TaxID=7070 RepID=D6WD03_TRICA|nr:PREDICTED: cytoskeleton-associated protein 5 [Tribolium castaneum]XP_015838364.1 PREDICTED: cytoskeleton-associated protein 5 [Tribolium castaneum]EEZ99362.1 mini spindles [Tribolium castaneum]|eukprot:XP_008200968.1 PREDICTED: cytoskeleton-associated protein 5 [Tribolium castaneum]